MQIVIHWWTTELDYWIFLENDAHGDSDLPIEFMMCFILQWWELDLLGIEINKQLNEFGLSLIFCAI